MKSIPLWFVHNCLLEQKILTNVTVDNDWISHFKVYQHQLFHSRYGKLCVPLCTREHSIYRWRAWFHYFSPSPIGSASGRDGSETERIQKCASIQNVIFLFPRNIFFGGIASSFAIRQRCLEQSS
jgi:hypothetical protein